MPATAEALAGCSKLPPDLARTVSAVVDALKYQLSEASSFDSAQLIKHPTWLEELCPLVLGRATIRRVPVGAERVAIFERCEFGRLELLTRAEWSEAEGAPYLGLLLGSWLRAQGHPAARSSHVARIFAARRPSEPPPHSRSSPLRPTFNPLPEEIPPPPPPAPMKRKTK